MQRRTTQKSTNTRRIGLARALSKLGYCSRSVAEELVRAGRVMLNGQAPRNPETPVQMEKDRIEVDGNAVQAVARIYWMLNKPQGVVTTADDERGRKTVYDLLPKDLPWLGPVGRLDMASEGLLLLSNDTEWAARITAPESHVEKTYHVQINRIVGAELLQQLEAGIKDQGDLLKARRAVLSRTGDKNCWIEVVLDEGKNRQIRRMIEASGLEVLRLVRVAIGLLPLGDLPQGQTRPLTPAELQLLNNPRSS